MAYENRIATAWANWVQHVQGLVGQAPSGLPAIATVVDGELGLFDAETPCISMRIDKIDVVAHADGNQAWSVPVKVRIVVPVNTTTSWLTVVLAYAAQFMNRVQSWNSPDGVTRPEAWSVSFAPPTTSETGNLAMIESFSAFTVHVKQGAN